MIPQTLRRVQSFVFGSPYLPCQTLHLQNSYKMVTIVPSLQGKSTKEATFMFCFSNFDCSALLQMLCQSFSLGC